MPPCVPLLAKINFPLLSIVNFSVKLPPSTFVKICNLPPFVPSKIPFICAIVSVPTLVKSCKFKIPWFIPVLPNVNWEKLGLLIDATACPILITLEGLIVTPVPAL